MVKTPRVLTLGKIAKGPFQFLRYTNKDRLSAELINPYAVERRKIDGREFVSAKTFKESTSNIAPTLVAEDDFTLPPE